MLLVVLFEVAVVILFIVGMVLALRDRRLRQDHPAVLYQGLLTCFLLVLLRLSIGWHFFFEGVEKVKTPGWSSEPYLREASGPAAPMFRWMAGDPLFDRLYVPPLQPGQDPSRTQAYSRFPPMLERDWRLYYDRFTEYYGLSPEQQREAETRFQQNKDQTALWLVQGGKKVKRESPYGPPVEVDLRVPERVAEYAKKRDEANRLQEESFKIFGPDVTAQLRAAKAEVGKLRAELRRDLDEQNAAMQKALRDVLTVDQVKRGVGDVISKQLMELPPIRQEDVQAALDNREELVKAEKDIARTKASLQEIESKSSKLEPAEADKQKSKLQKDLESFEVARKKAEENRAKERKVEDLNKSLGTVLRAEQLSQDPLEGKVKPSFAQMTRLERIDWITKWGLVAVGVCLLAGLFTRTACVAGAGLLLMFYLAMPAFPGLPDNPKAEGHYLLINKNVIEMLALLALATTRSGRWLGIDGFLQFLNPRRWRSEQPNGTREESVLVSDVAPPAYAGGEVLVHSKEPPLEIAKEPGHGH